MSCIQALWENLSEATPHKKANRCKAEKAVHC